MGESPNTCQYNPENTFRALDVILPNELTQKIHDETRKQLIDCFIHSLHIDSPLGGVKEIFMTRLSNLLEEDPTLVTDTNGEVMQEIVYQAAGEYLKKNPSIVFDPEISYIIINNYVINFSHISIPSDTGMVSSLRPKPRPDITQLIGTSIPLSRYYEIAGFGEKLESSINLLFSERLGKESLTSLEEIQVMKLLKFVLGVETFGGKNIVLEDNIARPSGFYQFQVKDGSFGKEAYDFKTETWKNYGEWTSEDREVKITKGDDKIWVRKIRKYSSYEQALLSLSDSIKGQYPALLEQERTIGNPNLQHPESLTHEEQTILFLSNIISKGGTHSKELFTRILAGDDTAIIELYREIHHADKSREDTLKTVQNVALKTLGISYKG